MPHLEPASDHEAPQAVDSTGEEALQRSLSTTLAKWPVYWLIFDPLTPTPEAPVAGYLPGDLSEIYRDVQNSRAAWASADVASQRDAVWQMRFDFEHHWGRHAVAAMSAIHALLFDQYVEALEDA